VAVLHRAHTSGFCRALEHLPHSVALLLSLSTSSSSFLASVAWASAESFQFYFSAQCRAGHRHVDVARSREARVA